MKTLAALSLFISIGLASVGQVAIGPTSFAPDPSAGLDVKFSDKGFLPPRMTTTERDAISNPAHGLQIYNTTTDCINYRVGLVWYSLCGTPPIGTIASLDCAGATPNGTLTDGVSADGVNSSIGYTGGNGGTHNGQTVSSTGVTGLTATLAAGLFVSGSGALTYTITGIPSSSGTASFAINIGGQTCTLSRTVASPPCGSSLTDARDNAVYTTVLIGSQCWMAQNLAYLPVVHSNSQFATQGTNTQPGYGVYGYNGSDVVIAKSQANYATYGVLYNWWAVMAGEGSSVSNPSGVQGICPSGWHLPSDAEWTTLTDYLGGESAGGAMKSTTGWTEPNTGATNSSGFSGLPGGYRTSNGDFLEVGNNGNWRSSTEYSANNAWYRPLFYNTGSVSRYGTNKLTGFSCRCIKD